MNEIEPDETTVTMQIDGALVLPHRLGIAPAVLTRCLLIQVRNCP
jgi:hypothetical protein